MRRLTDGGKVRAAIEIAKAQARKGSASLHEILVADRAADGEEGLCQRCFDAGSDRVVHSQRQLGPTAITQRARRVRAFASKMLRYDARLPEKWPSG